jgi:hypothetical protein
MRTQVIETVPTRENWESFCEEEPLTEEEWVAWYSLAEVARENDEVASFIESEAADEIAEHDQFEFTYDWSCLVQSSDRFKRMRRAQIAAWAKWQASQ